MFGCQLRITRELKDCLRKTTAISIAYDKPGLALSYDAGQFTVRIANENGWAPSCCYAVILAGNDQALEIGLQGYQMQSGAERLSLRRSRDW